MASEDVVSLSIPALLLTLLLSLLSHSLFTTGDNNSGISLITETCNRTEYSQLCRSTLESDHRSFTADLSGLCRIATEISDAKANITLSQVTELLNNASEYPIWANLQVCQYAYNRSTYRMAEEGVPAVYRGDYKTAHQMVGLVNQAAADCNKTGIALLSQGNTMLFRLTVDTMTMLRLLF